MDTGLVCHVECLFSSLPACSGTNLYCLVNRGTCVWTSCPELLHGAKWPGLEPATSWLQVRHPNHYVTQKDSTHSNKNVNTVGLQLKSSKKKCLQSHLKTVDGWGIVNSRWQPAPCRRFSNNKGMFTKLCQYFSANKSYFNDSWHYLYTSFPTINYHYLAWK